MTTSAFPIIIDNSIKLITLDLKRAGEFYSLIECNRPYLREWLGWVDNMQSITNLNNYIEAAIKDYHDQKSYRAWILQHEKIIGIIHLVEINWNTRNAMIGYWVSKDYRGQGIVTKACKALTDFAFHDLKLSSVEIRCATGNTASQAIPKKLGFKEDGIIRDGEWLYDHHVDHVVFSKHAKDLI